MSIEVTSAALAALNRTVSAVFQQSYEASEGYRPWYTKLCVRVPSSSSANVYPFAIDSGAVREWESGERHVNSIGLGSCTVTNKRYELTYGINRDQLADDQTGVLLMKVRGGAAKFRMHPDRLMAAIFSANSTCLDGLALFHASHKVNPLGTATYANLQAGRPLTPANAALTRAEMAARLAADGDPLSPSPRLLIVPPTLEREALQIAVATTLPNDGATASQDNVLKGMFDVLVIPQLEAISTTQWYLADVSDPNDRPLIFQEREPLEFVQLFNPSDPQVFMRNEYLWGASYRAAAAAGNPAKITRCAP